jgi:hypothetical protein
LHTVSVTEREQLAAAGRAAGLRLSAQDVAALLPAWKRYLGLVEELRAAMAPGDGDDGD